MSKVFIIGGLRTPIVISGTKFKKIRPEILGAEVIKNLVKKYKIESFDEIICGNAVGTGGNIARLMMLEGKFDEKISALTVDRQCASGAAAISIGYAKILSGICECVIVGGAESSSLQPLRIYDEKDERYLKISEKNVQGGYYYAQFSPKELDKFSMIRGAERVAQAEKITKKELDAWAIISHKRAAKSVEILQEKIIEIFGIKFDNGIKIKNLEKIMERAPLPLGKNTVTSAGNSCRINDGAAFILLASEKFAKKNNLKPSAEILDVMAGGVNPLESPRGAMAIADKILEKNKISYENLSAIEFNEAFAVIDVLFERSHENLVEIYNKFGGAIAYGHPYGASGAILMINLLKSLEKNGGIGLMSIAGAGGTGEAILIKNKNLRPKKV